MTATPASADDVLKIDIDGNVAIVTINRPQMRNALDEAAVAKIDAFFSNIPPEVGAVVLQTEGPHFCAGLDLKEHHAKRRSPTEFMRVCQGWHRAFDKMQHGGIPVIAAMQGAVVGGGLELAAAAHVRVADRTAYFALPEGQRGIFTGDGANVRVARIITPGPGTGAQDRGQCPPVELCHRHRDQQDLGHVGHRRTLYRRSDHVHGSDRHRRRPGPAGRFRGKADGEGAALIAAGAALARLS